MQTPEAPVPVPGEEPENLNHRVLIIDFDRDSLDRRMLTRALASVGENLMWVDDMQELLVKLEPEPTPTEHKLSRYPMNDFHPRIYSLTPPQPKYHEHFQTAKVPKLRPRGRGR